MESDLLWYKDAIIYELHVKAFADSDNDGIGDMKGLMQKLDYLEDLGVTAIWLLPFYPSPLRDDGYDISDYYSINPNYGNIATFKKLVQEAHRRNLKVITELVINHTSDQHPWFQRARKSPPGSKYRDYYVWSDDPTKYKDARIIFTDYEPSNWSWDPVAQSYYWHRFFHHQPDLNFDNPDVQQEIFNIMDFWIDMGVDGFRLDAIPYLFERDGTNCENLPETHVFLKELRQKVEEKKKGVMFLAEANMWPEDSVSYFGEGDECHMNYHFPIMPRLFMALKMEDRYPIIDIIDQTPAIPENCQWAIFLRNHDELTLEMVTDEERDYMYKAYTKDAKAKINLGIRQRLAPLLENNRAKIELMNMLLFSLPGTPVLYYGDEIGMGDNYYLGDRDGVRTPMQWSPDRNGGFSKANPQKLYLPMIIDPAYNYESVNVETQQATPSSLLWWMKRTMHMRKKFKAFSRGDIEFLAPQNPKVLAFIRSYEEEEILVVINLSRYAQAVELDLEDYHGKMLVEVFGQNPFPAIKSDNYTLTLSPYGYYWFSLQPEEETYSEEALPELRIDAWMALQNTQVLAQMQQQIIPKYLKKSSWFNIYHRKVQGLEIIQLTDTSSKSQESCAMLLEVSFLEGLPEKYWLNMVFIPADDTDALHDMDDRATIAKAYLNGEPGYLVSAEQSHPFLIKLFRRFTYDKQLPEKDPQLIFKSVLKTSAFNKLSSLSTRLTRLDGYNTSAIIGDQYLVKLYHEIDDAPNSDVEVTRFLSEESDFSNIGKYLGEAVLQDDNAFNKPFAMIQSFQPTQGTGWTYLTEVFKNFYDHLSIKLNQQDFSDSKKKLLASARINGLWNELLPGDFLEQVGLLGRRTAELHKALTSNTNPAFKPEAFSLHYQRSLYSGFKGTVRSAMQTIKKHINHMDEDSQEKAAFILKNENAIQTLLKRVYAHKIDTLKVRNHGDMRLNNVLWTGNDFIFMDFEGEGVKTFSERRIKRSSLRDVATLQRSIHYAAYYAILNFDFSLYDDARLPDWADALYRVVSNVYYDEYCSEIKDSGILPTDKDDLAVLHDTFMLERLLYEIKMQPFEGDHWWAVPVHALENMIKQRV